MHGKGSHDEHRCCCVHRPSGRRAAEKRDELAPSQLIELHLLPASQGRMQDIELARISQEVTERFYNLLAVGERP
jgi:hypothetical protein